MSEFRRCIGVVYVLGAVAAPPAVSGQVVLTTDAGAFDAYVWRGVTLTNQFVLQPDLYVSIPAAGGSAVLGGWGTIDAGQYDDPVEDLSEGGGTSSMNATELNIWAEYAHALVPGLTGTLGSLLYLYPNEAGLTNEINQTVEVYGKLQVVSPLNPKLAAWYDVDKVKGLYLEGSVSQPVTVIKGFPLTLGALAGFSVSQGVNTEDPSEVANFAGNSLTHVDLAATGALSVGPITVSPTVHVLLLNDEFTQVTKPGTLKDAKAWGGVSLTWSKALTDAPAATSE